MVPFSFGRFRDGEHVFVGVVADDLVVDAGSLLGSRPVARVEDLFDAWDEHVVMIGSAIAAGLSGARTVGELVRLAPVEPRQMFLAGMNYRTHVVELLADQGAGSRPDMTREEIRAEAAAMMDQRARSGIPFVFTGLPTSICGPDDEIHLRFDSQQSDWELELAAVIGRPARSVSPADALNYVAGWTIANDLTCRDLIRRTDSGPMGADFLRAKLAPGYKPIGPYVVPAVFVDDPQALTITLELNGEVKQRESTADMVFDVATLVSYCSHQAQLLPGDLLLTGSPAGNGTHYGRFLQPGDVLVSQITGLGVQRNVCVA